MRTRTGHVVVDGSNIATEGRSMPSLAQLNEAVLAFLAEFPGTTVTVVVDATFGHRIEKSEVKEFDSAIANNELVAPPAGAVGRGDAFVLSIANKAGAAILSNDSFQEFHGDYTWLFDDGRLVGGKPVPHVGWVFVDRVPVRGPVSRKAVRESQSDGGRARRSRGGGVGVARTGSKEASQPMPVPQAPPPGKAAARRAADAAALAADATTATTSRSRRSGRGRGAAAAAPNDAPSRADSSTSAPKSGESVNDLMAFLDFVEHHPVGTSVNAIVESYSSHGAYVRIGDVRGYVPLRLMADPPPRSAREVMKIDDAVTLVVASFAPARRSIDCATPDMATDLESQDPATVIEETTTAAALVADFVAVGQPAGSPKPKKSTAKRTAAKKSAAATQSVSKKAAARKSTETPGETTAAMKAPATRKSAAAKKSAATKKAAAQTPTATISVAKTSVGKTSPAKTSPAKKSPAKKSPAKKSPAKKTPAKKTSARTTPAKTTPAEKTPARTTPAKQAPAKKTAAKKAPAANAAPRRTSRRAASTAETSTGQ